MNVKSYLCISCFTVFESEEAKCTECEDEDVMETYNASDSSAITNSNLYK